MAGDYNLTIQRGDAFGMTVAWQAQNAAGDYVAATDLTAAGTAISLVFLNEADDPPASALLTLTNAPGGGITVTPGADDDTADDVVILALPAVMQPLGLRDGHYYLRVVQAGIPKTLLKGAFCVVA